MRNATGSSKEPLVTESVAGIYDATVKKGVSCGYNAQWRIELADDGQTLTAEELEGSNCCGGVPNCCRKSGYFAHR